MFKNEFMRNLNIPRKHLEATQQPNPQTPNFDNKKILDLIKFEDVKLLPEPGSSLKKEILSHKRKIIGKTLVSLEFHKL